MEREAIMSSNHSAPATLRHHLIYPARTAGVTGYLLESSPNMAASSWNPVTGVTGNSHTLLPRTKSIFRMRRQ